MGKNKWVKSPLNYTGGKYRLLDQIMPLLPREVDTFYDLFCGGCNVGINIDTKGVIEEENYYTYANKVVCNDKIHDVINCMNGLKELDSEGALRVLKETIYKYGLSKTNEEGFKDIRGDYNKGNKSWDMFYAMIAHAFNNQIRFNNRGEYNISFGRNKSSFNSRLEKVFIEYVDKLNETNIEFINRDFRYIEDYGKNDLIYCDPPYLIAHAHYNANAGWTDNDEIELLKYLDDVNEGGIKFALSNVIEHKGKSNDILKEWMGKYNVNYLKHTYKNAMYNIEDRNKGGSVEVLITNY